MVPPASPGTGFSFVGRILDSGWSILFCKTDAAVLDAKRRPQPLIHALFGEQDVLDLWAVNAIPADFWLKSLTDSKIPKLSDVEVTAIIPSRADGLRECGERNHDCSKVDRRAALLLNRLSQSATGRGESDLAGPVYAELVDDLLVALPSSAWSYVELEHYRDGIEVTAQVRLRLPGATPSSQPLESVFGCPLSARVNREAPLLFSRTGGIQHFASAVLGQPRPADQKLAGRAPPAPAPAPAPVPSPVHRSLDDLIAAARLDNQRWLPPRSALAVATQLRQSGESLPGIILEASTQSATDLLATTGTMGDLNHWSKILGPLSLSDLLGLWERTEVALFVGLILLRHPTDDELSGRVMSSIGVNPTATAEILVGAASRPHAASDLATVLRGGLAGSEPVRRFTASALSAHPKFLFDGVLANADLPSDAHLDFIRAEFEVWSRYRQLSRGDKAALERVLHPSILERVRALMGGTSSKRDS